MKDDFWMLSSRHMNNEMAFFVILPENKKIKMKLKQISVNEVAFINVQ